MVHSLAGIITLRSANCYLPADFVPSKHDVWIGRGKKVHAHPGNQKLRAIVQSEVEAYSNAKNRADKTSIIAKVFEAIRADSPIGFVKRDPATKVFITVEDTTAKITIAQYFRDALADQRRYKSSKKYKQQLRDAVRRSVSVGDEQDDSLVTSCSHTDSLLRSSAPEQTCGQLKFPQKTLLASCFQNAADSVLSMKPMEKPLSSTSFGTTTIAAENPCHNIHSFRNFLQTVADLLEDDDCGFLNDVEESISSAAVTLTKTQDETPSKDLFSSLFSAFGSDVVVTPDPYEPTPIDEY